MFSKNTFSQALQYPAEHGEEQWVQFMIPWLVDSMVGPAEKDTNLN